MKDQDTLILEQLYLEMSEDMSSISIVKNFLDSEQGGKEELIKSLQGASDYAFHEELFDDILIRTNRDTYIIIPDYFDITPDEVEELNVEDRRGKDDCIVILSNGWVLVDDNLLKDDDEKASFLWGLDEMDVWKYTGRDLAEEESQELNEYPPDFLYHETSEEAWEQIQEDGVLKPMNETRGISNRSTGAAIFTHSDEDEAFNYVYGDVILKINIKKYKDDGNKINLSSEEPYTESRSLQLLAAMIDYQGDEDFNPDSSDGLSEGTVLIHHEIPLEYIERIQ